MSTAKRCGNCTHWSGHATQKCQHPEASPETADYTAYETDHCDGWEAHAVFGDNPDSPKGRTKRMRKEQT